MVSSKLNLSMKRGNYILGKLVMLKYRNGKIHNGPQTLYDEEYKENEKPENKTELFT